MKVGGGHTDAFFYKVFQAFLLNEPGYSDKNTEPYGSDPIVIIDLLGAFLPQEQGANAINDIQ